MRSQLRVSSEELVNAACGHFLHAQILGDWVVDYIDLEESLAVGSIVQEELAHASTLIELAGYDPAGRDDIIYQQPAGQWYPTRMLMHKWHNWPMTVLRALLLSTAAMTYSIHLDTDGEPALKSASRILLAEQQLHVMHWTRWIHLLNSHEGTRQELQDCAAQVMALTGDMFGDFPGSPPEGVRQAMHASWISRTLPLLTEIGIEPSQVPTAPSSRTAVQAATEGHEILMTIRALRVGRNDGVRGLYR